MNKFNAHRIIVRIFRIICTFMSCKEILGTFAVWSQAKRRGSTMDDDHITRIACTCTNSCVWPGAPALTVGTTRLALVQVI